MGELKDQSIRLLLIEDVEAEAERTLYHLRQGGMDCDAQRVETGPELVAALRDFSPAIILSDFSLPQFDGMTALRICREQAPDIPFIFVSGTIGEERAVAALHAGASDYVQKENLMRLVPAAKRAMGDARAKAERLQQQAQIARLNRVLRMLSGVSELVFRLRDRTELLAETCRLAISVGGYAMAVAATAARAGVSIKAVASNGLDDETTALLRAYVEESGARESSVIGTVFRTGREFVCNDTIDIGATARFDALMLHAGLRSVVVLPLLVDSETSAVLLLTARDSGKLGAEELGMLRELSRNLSFGLQYVNRDTRVRFLSYFHPQTGLARRSLFSERVHDQVSAARTSPCVVVMLDIRRLGSINDSFGRGVGDTLLRMVAERLKQHDPKQEHLAHFGGGTFALLLGRGAPAQHELPAFGEALARKLFGEHFRIEERSIPLTARFAYALYPDDGADATTLLQNVEAALQYARAGGHSHVRFDSAVKKHSVGHLALEHRLRLALERNEFELHYQPKVDVVTRRIQGAEALLRWRSPEEGLMAPGMFLSVLESSGLILQVGDWVVEQAARDCRAWMQARLPPIRVAVNIAPAQLRHHEFEDRFLKAVGSWTGRFRGLDIEITEGVLQDDCHAEVKKLQRLRARGVRIAVDDFGTGYSSLSRLSELPVDTLKIDRRFVSQAVDSATGATVVKTIVSLARAFNMTSVAEGVEKQQELDLLWQAGCDQSQGYLHCMPLPATEFAMVLQSGRGAFIQPPELVD